MRLATSMLSLVALSMCACGGVLDTTDDAGSTTDAAAKMDASASPEAESGAPLGDAGAVFPGPHPMVPQVSNAGGPVLDAPKVIPIFFANDAKQADTEDFMNALAASPFWSESTKEYGAGPLSIGASIVVTDTPPATIDVAGVESWLASHLDGSQPTWPPIAQNNIYTVFYPATTTIADSNFGTSCVDFGGYHYEAQGPNGKGIVYAVMPRCNALGQNVQGYDALTAGLSHELIEAATDPLATSPAWSYVDFDHMVWNFMPLGEIGDMCAYEPQSYQRLVGKYMVQRPWSNASAMAGHDPCVPTLADPYYNAAPVLTEDVTLDYYGQAVTTKGVKIPLGQSKTIDVQLFSDATISDWTVQAVDATYGTSQPKELSFSWDSQQGNNGSVLHLTITRVAAGPHDGSEFLLYAQHGFTTANMWFGFVAN